MHAYRRIVRTYIEYLNKTSKKDFSFEQGISQHFFLTKSTMHTYNISLYYYYYMIIFMTVIAIFAIIKSSISMVITTVVRIVTHLKLPTCFVECLVFTHSLSLPNTLIHFFPRNTFTLMV